MFSYLTGMSPFRNKVDVSQFQIPTIIITPPEPTLPSTQITSFSSESKIFVPATETPSSSGMLCIQVPPNHCISSMPMPQLLKPARPVRQLIVANVIRTEFNPHNQRLSTQSHIRVILKSSLRGKARRNTSNSALRDDIIRVDDDELLKLDFENYVKTMYGNQRSRDTPVPKEVEQNNIYGNSANPGETSNDAEYYGFNDDHDAVVFAIPVYDAPSSPSPPGISPERWEPKTIVIDIEKATKPPSSISPFRYCAIMMNAEMSAVANGATVVSNEDEFEGEGEE
ncbi:hypothetical protein BJ165DRAFT_1533843 [Panaeolus papilionaceus]|nr:hypothetical protein BJ165DRAFT_1533843 [Panaeolus papilionaceus]